MTEQEYLNKIGDVIGLCEICHYYKECAKKGTLKEDGCNHHSNFEAEQ